MSIITNKQAFLEEESKSYVKREHTYYAYHTSEEWRPTEYGDPLGGKTTSLQNVERKVKVSAKEYNDDFRNQAGKETEVTTYTLKRALQLINNDIEECKDTLAGNKKKLNLYKKKVKVLEEVAEAADDFEWQITLSARRNADFVKPSYVKEMKEFSTPFIEKAQLKQVEKLMGLTEARIIELEAEKVSRKQNKEQQAIKDEIARLQSQLV